MELTPETKKQMLRFIGSGILAVSVDLLTYLLLKNYFSYNFSKGLSFFIGTMVAYVLNKFWTFEEKKYSNLQLLKFFLLYGLTLAVNVVINNFVLGLFYSVIFAFLCATGTSTVLNFVGQKFWVFKK